jgi:mono/diheme cytochrome c family protein
VSIGKEKLILPLIVSAVLAGALSRMVAPAPARAQAKPASRPTVLDGVFTEAQAGRGEEAFATKCAMCHEGTCTDGPALTGTPFIDEWREDTLESLFTFIKTRMPRDAQGSLSESMYLDILAHILETNHYRAGSKELTAAVVKSTLLVGEDGPKPLPNNATVDVVGCLAPGPNNAWLLAQAGEPARTRDATEITAEELKSAEARPLGAATFRLRNLEDLQGFNGDAGKGHKVQVKGVLVRESNNDRINALSLKALPATCTR